MQEGQDKTMFQQRREEEGRGVKPFKDWEADEMRLARHVKVPVSLWKFEEQWACEEDQVSSLLFGPNGSVFGRENQEEVLGLNAQDTREDGKAPDGAGMHNTDGTKPHHTSNRPDTSPRNLYLKDGFINHDDDEAQANNPACEHVRDFYKGSMGADETDQVDRWSRSVEAMKQQRAREDLHHTAMNFEQVKDDKRRELSKKFEDQYNQSSKASSSSSNTTNQRQRRGTAATYSQHPHPHATDYTTSTQQQQDSNSSSESVADRAAREFAASAASNDNSGMLKGRSNPPQGFNGPRGTVGGLHARDSEMEDLDSIWGKH